MNPGPKAIRAIVSMLLLSTAALWAQVEPARYHSLVPLGAEAYEIRGENWKGTLTLLGSAESPQFEGMFRRAGKQHDELFFPEGTEVSTYPPRVSFRVTSTFRSRFADPSPFPIGAATDENDYLLGLQFRIVVFHGLRQTVLQPDAVEMIGMPSDVPYDERVYRVSADLGDIPVTDRVVLEVLSPEGGRICKFHLDLF